jgi:iron complex outermembrane recepter protein
MSIKAPTKIIKILLLNPLGFFRWVLLSITRPMQRCSRFVELKVCTKKRIVTKVSRIVVMVLWCCAWSSGYADEDTVYDFAIPAVDVEEALKKLATQTSHQLFFSYKPVDAQTSTAVSGKHTVKGALELLLNDTDLFGRITKRGVILVTSVHANKNTEKRELGMKAKKNILASIIGMLVGAGGIQQTSAQDEIGGHTESRWALEEIVVTAQKREQNLSDVPISIVAMGAAEMEARGISDFEDMGLAIPGLTVQDDGGTSRRVFIRGLANGAGFTSSLIGLYVDDMSVSGNPAYTLDLRPYDMERVEVLRGPQGTLYGDGSVGGTIRFITKKPQLDRFSGKTDITAFFTEGGDPSQKIQGAVNVPLINEALGLRIAATYENTGGWINHPAVSNDNYNEQEAINVRTNLLWYATEALEVSAMAIVHRNDASLNISEDENGNFTQVLGLSTTPSVDDEYELYNLSLIYDLGSFEITSSTGYLDSSTETNELGSIFPTSHDLLDDYIVDSSILNQELRASSISDGAWRWTLGAFYKDRKIDQLIGRYLSGTPTEVTFGPISFSDIQDSQSWAVFGDTSYAVTERLELGVGMRYFEDERNFFDGTTTQSGSFDSLSPRLYVNFDLTQDIKTYGSVAKGFRSGGFNTLGQPEFEPETIWSYELGTKISLLDGRLNAELAVFYSDYKEFQVTGVVKGSPQAITSNGGDAEIKGLDASLVWQATENLMLGFSGNYVDSKVVALNVASATHVVDDSLDYVSKYSATLSATQNFEWGARAGFARLDYNYQDRMFLSNRRLGVFGSSDIITMLNFNVELALNEAISIGFFGKNLLDERGLLDPRDAIGVASRSRPRSYGVQLGLDF